jgi:hypothetical protein
METEYRGHLTKFCRKLVDYVKDLASSGLTFDGTFAHYQIKPDLVIHGGDISDGTYGTWDQEGSDAADVLFSDVWQQLYDAGIPMISGLGNHDFSTSYTDRTNQQANKFVLDSFLKTKSLLGQDFDFTEIIHPHVGADGPSLFKAEFRGFQIAHLNYHGLFMDPNGIQFDAFSNSLDRTKKTIFISHFPVSHQNVKELVWEFPGAAHLSGHVHVPGQRTIRNPSNAAQSFVDYTAAYPHPWELGNTGAYYDPGMYAALVSPTQGVLQVKSIVIPYEAVTGCWPDGTICGVGTTCNQCCHENRRALGTKCGGEKWSDGTICGLGTTCRYCKNEATFWYGKVFTACGIESCWGDGTVCLPGTSCNRCCNDDSWWFGDVAQKCGDEPCWSRGTVCGIGTTCKSCCTGNSNANCPWYYFGVCTCR